jgi:hypothetical protein
MTKDDWDADNTAAEGRYIYVLVNHLVSFVSETTEVHTNIKK